MRERNFLQSIYVKVLIPLLLVMGLLFGYLIEALPDQLMVGAIDSAERDAIRMAEKFKTLRGYYTKNVVAKVIKGSEMRPTWNHAGDPTAIPLPASMIHDLSEIYAEDVDWQIKLYSDFPFPNRAGRQLDSFQRRAWSKLSQDSGATYTEQVSLHGEQFLRVAIADTMTQQGCVSCHNTHPDTPKNDWRMGDTRGVLEVVAPLQSDIDLAAGVVSSIQNTVVMAGVVIALLLALLLFTQVSRPLHKLADILANAGENLDLTSTVDLSQRDEVGTAVRSLGRVFKRLRDSIGEVQNAVQQVATAASQSSEAVGQVSDGSHQQAEALSQIAHSIAESTRSMSQVTKAANEASDSSSQAATLVAGGRDEMSKMVGAVQKMADNSQRIERMAGVIGEIASQTNMLSLNAAIEAARAGEHGKGFAVVAEQVRKLAESVAGSVEEITAIVMNGKLDAEQAVAIARRVNDEMGEISGAAASASQMLSQIVGDVDVQRGNISNIESNIATLKAVGDGNAAAAEEISQTIFELSQVAAETRTTLGQFKV